jgi:hypothetical protein
MKRRCRRCRGYTRMLDVSAELQAMLESKR